MSTKASIFLTKDNEHCYHDMLYRDGDKNRMFLEIDEKNLMGGVWEDGTLTIAIRGDSELAQYINKIRWPEK